MPNVHVPQPQNVRSIKGSFAWVDHRVLRDGYIPVMTHQDQAFYLFLLLAADRNGVSFYRKEKICDILALDFQQFEVARDRLIDLNLIAYQPYTVLSPNGHYQVLPIETAAANFAKKIMEPLTQKVTNAWNPLNK